MANIAQTVNVLQAMVLTDGERMVLTPSYHVFAMLACYREARLLASRLECEDYDYGDDGIPAVSTSASKSADGQTDIGLCNLNPHKSVAPACGLRGGRYRGSGGSVLKGSTMNAHNSFGTPDRVTPAAFEWLKKTEEGFDVELPPMSVVVMSLSA